MTVYSHGHHASVLASHGARTADNSAAYLLERLQPGMSLLDIGCGPGSITLDLAQRVAPGMVVGIDSVEPPLVAARAAANERGDTTTRFKRADVYALPFADDSFDIVHAHQVLQHLGNPVGALREMRRVARPGGVLAVRDADYASMTWYPELPGLTRWLDVYRALARHNGAEPDAGRRLLTWCRAAGLTNIVPTASVWDYATPEARQWWGGQWVRRATESAFAEQSLAAGLATEQDLSDIAEAWTTWTADEDGWFGMLHAEVLATC